MALTWIHKLKQGGRDFVRRLSADQRGNVAMMFAIVGPILMLISFGGVDLHRASTVRLNLRDALDAAALAAARSPYVDDHSIQEVGLKALKANLAGYSDAALNEQSVTFVLTNDGRVVGDASVNVKTWVANIVLPPYGQLLGDSLPVSAHTEVDRASKNIEVAMVLDVTGSMSGSRINALREAARDLVDTVVQDQQTPYYSKVALVPYAATVNPGSYSNAARGTVVGSTSITGMARTVGAATSVTGASKSSGITLDMAGHPFAKDDVVWVTGVLGMTDLNNRAFVVHSNATNKIQLRNLDGTNVSVGALQTYLGGGQVSKCIAAACDFQATSNSHGLNTGDYVYITDVVGLNGLNNKSYVANVVNGNTVILGGSGSATGAYTGGGKSWCAMQGCTYQAFFAANGTLRTNKVTACATERVGAAAYTDAKARNGQWVGGDYPASSGNCLGSIFQPLSANRQMLKDQIADFQAEGTTAGQIGLAWGWYALSPNFNDLWPSAAAGAYRDPETLKVVVMMTDGEFNTNYCQGVIAKDAGQGSSSERINCNATNGSPYDQSKALCDGMKQQGIVIFTVGLQINANGSAANVLRYCASSASNFHLANQASDLTNAFASIGRDITQLKISR